MLARERQRIGAQGTHEVFLAKLLEPTLVHMLVAYTIYVLRRYSNSAVGTPPPQQ